MGLMDGGGFTGGGFGTAGSRPSPAARGAGQVGRSRPWWAGQTARTAPQSYAGTAPTAMPRVTAAARVGSGGFGGFGGGGTRYAIAPPTTSAAQSPSYPPPTLPANPGGMTPPSYPSPGTTIPSQSPSQSTAPSRSDIMSILAGRGSTPTSGPGYVNNSNLPQPANGNSDLAYQIASSQYGVDAATLQAQRDAILARQGLLTGNSADQAAALRRNSDLARQLLGTQSQSNALNAASIARQQGYYANLGGLNEQGIGVQRADARATSATDTRNTQSDYTARGAWTTPGLGRDLSDIAGTLSRRLTGLDVDSRTNTANTDEQVARLSDRRNQLDVSARQLGIQSQQLGAQLDGALAQLGLQSIMNVGDLMDALNGNDAQRRQLAQQILTYSMQLQPNLPANAGAGLPNVGNQWVGSRPGQRI